MSSSDESSSEDDFVVTVTAGEKIVASLSKSSSGIEENKEVTEAPIKDSINSVCEVTKAIYHNTNSGLYRYKSLLNSIISKQ